MATDSPRAEASAPRPDDDGDFSDSPDSLDSPDSPDSPDFAGRFRRVISVIYPKDLGRPWRDSEIAEGTGLSGTYIGNLRKGTQKPSLENAVKIAKFFGVPLDYFSDSATAQAVERDLRKIEALRDARVERIAMRAAGLPPEMQDAALTVVEQLRKAVGLPEGQGDDRFDGRSDGRAEGRPDGQAEGRSRE
ncbi:MULTISPECIES: helix-turn-helix domain-containing protein [unclassified Streptomyces]|uniref:helix-turn-helix domain-containing protein n=1 Tax=unclassified Streptomyces TaxID=2593676 RepID=UPI002E2841FE|nr:helix-turn-helix transcriptional regulator [Streptomyces sp. NBC_01429]